MKSKLKNEILQLKNSSYTNFSTACYTFLKLYMKKKINIKNMVSFMNTIQMFDLNIVEHWTWGDVLIWTNPIIAQQKMDLQQLQFFVYDFKLARAICFIFNCDYLLYCDVVLLFVEDVNVKKDPQRVLSVTELRRKVSDQQHSVYTYFFRIRWCIDEKMHYSALFFICFFFIKYQFRNFIQKSVLECFVSFICYCRFKSSRRIH